MNVKNSKLLHALAPVLAISIVLTTGVIATNTSAAAASIKLPTPAHLAATPVSATAISVTFDSVDHASSYTVKVSSATSEAVIGPVHKNFISGSQIDGLSANTRYRVLVMAAGNDKQYKDSDESKRVNVSTLALFISTPTYALSETHTVGSPITATPSGNWIPASPTLHYQWNKSLDGAHHWNAVANNSDSTSYTPVAGDIGWHLKVVVTASTAGYVDAIVTSNISATVASAAPTTYAIGATGPGGGIVFYYDSAGFNCGAGFTSNGSPAGGLCHYLEVAPSGWNNGGTPATDPTKVWAVTAYENSDVALISNFWNAGAISGIGLGLYNSRAIVDPTIYPLNDSSTAAGAARAYSPTVASVIYTDWYLPTTAEMNLLYQWNRAGGSINSGTGATFAGLVDSDYWSSEELMDGYAWDLRFYDNQWAFPPKQSMYYVRPVRAF
jgi:hypothetical protein